MHFGVVILAAGASVRMGRPKLLLPWGGKTILAHLIETWRELDAEQILVMVEAGSAVDQELTRVPESKVSKMVNPDPGQGMFSTLRCAGQWGGWADGLTHFVLALGDQPHVRPGTLRELMRFAGQNPANICQPARNGRPRHPVVMPKVFFLGFSGVGNVTLKEFLQSRDSVRRTFESDDAGLDLDLDTLEDYEKALKSCSRGHESAGN